jgi:hypothetical protein
MLLADYEYLLEEKPELTTVWICDNRYDDYANKPIRHIPPTKVVTVSNNDLPANKKIYYSKYHFRPVTNKGTMGSRIIASFDNTGFGVKTGVSLHIFLTEKECKEKYVELCDTALQGLYEHLRLVTKNVQDKINNVTNDKYKYC